MCIRDRCIGVLHNHISKIEQLSQVRSIDMPVREEEKYCFYRPHPTTVQTSTLLNGPFLAWMYMEPKNIRSHPSYKYWWCEEEKADRDALGQQWRLLRRSRSVERREETDCAQRIGLRRKLRATLQRSAFSRPNQALRHNYPRNSHHYHPRTSK